MVHWCWTRSCTVVSVSCHVFRASAEHDHNTLAHVSTEITDSRGPVTACLYHSKGVWTRVFSWLHFLNHSQFGFATQLGLSCLSVFTNLLWCDADLVNAALFWWCSFFFVLFRSFVDCWIICCLRDYYCLMLFLTEQCVSVALNPRVYFSCMHTLWYTYRVCETYLALSIVHVMYACSPNFVTMLILYAQLTGVFFSLQ